jgi:hypothetical protein
MERRDHRARAEAGGHEQVARDLTRARGGDPGAELVDEGDREERQGQPARESRSDSFGEVHGCASVSRGVEEVRRESADVEKDALGIFRRKGRAPRIGIFVGKDTPPSARA